MRNQGYTLIELMVVIVIFGVVMTVISVSFNRILAGSGQVIKSTETEIGGLIGLELMRVDLGFAGFGLPWDIGSGTSGANYGGESQSHLVNNTPATDAASFNEPSANGPPKAFAMANNVGFNGSDYLVIKGTALGMTNTARAWSYLNYSSSGPTVKQSKTELELIPGNGDQVIVLNSTMNGGLPCRNLVTSGSSFCVTFNYGGNKQLPTAIWPQSALDRYQVFGIAPAGTTVTFPFNRADYYIGPSDNPSSICAPGTGALYRGQVSQGGHFATFPVLDCVGDLQVIFMMDTSNDGSWVPYDNISTPYLRGLFLFDDTVDKDAPARAIRDHVKEVRVYVLAQQGKKDPGYSYPVTDPNNVIVLGDPTNGRAWKASDLAATFGNDWMHYHWKVYTIAVQPKNLQ